MMSSHFENRYLVVPLEIWHGYLFASVERNLFSLSEKMNKTTTRELPICETPSTASSFSV
jgi:hypothetical protein